MNILMKSLLAGLLAITAVGCARQERYVAVAEYVQPQTVMIEVDTVMKRMQFTMTEKGLVISGATVPVTVMGAGVLISRNGHILTCAHLFTNGPNKAVRVFTLDGSSVPATLIYDSPDKDLALVKVARSTTTDACGYATLGRSRLRIGQEVLAVGNPLGLGFSVAHGIISAFRPDFDNGYSFTQEDTAINHGNSGGPLFNLDGELIGINTLKAADGEGIGFAVSPETIREFLSLFHGV